MSNCCGTPEHARDRKVQVRMDARVVRFGAELRPHFAAMTKRIEQSGLDRSMKG